MRKNLAIQTNITYRIVTVLVLFSLLLGTAAPVVLAQGTTPPAGPTTGGTATDAATTDATTDAATEPGDPVALRVTATTPSSGASEVAVNSAIVVSFNRPVVPLVGASEQANLPQPLTISPEVAGAGEWVSTSIYRFQPDPALAGATEYSVVVAPLTTPSGEAMTEAFEFTFTTSTPLVVAATPSEVNAAPDTAVTVTFSQAMDRASTEAAFSLQNRDTEATIDGAFAWDDASVTLTFTPTANLDFGGAYAINVDASAQPASQVGNLRAAFHQEFSVVPLPAVIASTPT